MTSSVCGTWPLDAHHHRCTAFFFQPPPLLPSASKQQSAAHLAFSCIFLFLGFAIQVSSFLITLRFVLGTNEIPCPAVHLRLPLTTFDSTPRCPDRMTMTTTMPVSRDEAATAPQTTTRAAATDTTAHRHRVPVLAQTFAATSAFSARK